VRTAAPGHSGSWDGGDDGRARADRALEREDDEDDEDNADEDTRTRTKLATETAMAR